MLEEDLNKLIKNFPDVPGIHGSGEYLTSSVVILLTLIDGEYHMVFEKRSMNIRQGGEICFPGGRYDVDKDLNYEETALRETYEELGIPEDKIRIVGRLDTIVALMGQIIHVYVGVTETKIQEMKINKYEVEKVFSIPVSYFEQKKPEEHSIMVKSYPSYIDENTKEEVVLLPSKELNLPERYHKPWGNFKQKILVYKTDEGVIWGITARIIADFISKTLLGEVFSK